MDHVAWRDEMEGRSNLLALDKQAKGPLKITIYANQQKRHGPI